MKHIVLMFTALALMQGVAYADKMYRWVDKAGVVHYSDMPVPEAEQLDSRKFSSSPSPNVEMPFETRQATQNFPVTLYVAKNCGGICDQARSMLTDRGIPFSENVLKSKEDMVAFKKLSGFEDIPALAVGRNFLKGFQAAQWNSELDTAGYPKTSSYRKPAASQSPVPTKPEETYPTENQPASDVPATQ